MKLRSVGIDDFDADLAMAELRWEVIEAQRRQAEREFRAPVPHPLGARPVKSPERNVIG